MRSANGRFALLVLLAAALSSIAAFSAGRKSAAAGGGSSGAETPLEGMDIYLVGFHPMKGNPAHQMEAHHYCRQMNADFAQCALFDGNTKAAKLNGIEYIVSEKLFDALPIEERKYWHPHNYEILSGELAAPGIPKSAERSLIGGKMNSYGKTWHVWMTGTLDGAGDKLPLGDPMLAWSFNHDGEVEPGLVERRDKEMGIDSNALKSERKAFLPEARPQGGVDAIKSEFPDARPVFGVEDSGATPGHERARSARRVRSPFYHSAN